MIMKKLYLLSDYAGVGARLGAFTSMKKCIEFIKYQTSSSRLVFVDDWYHDEKTKWIGLGYFNSRKHFQSEGFIKCIREDEAEQERDIFRITVWNLTPETEEKIGNRF